VQRPDVILIHAPSIFEDRDISLLPVPSGTGEAQDNLSQRFRELLQASCYLKKNGHMPRIVDLPGVMAQSKLFNKEKNTPGRSTLS